jgi:hypothetical protein
MNLPPPEVCKRIRKLHGLVGSNNENEAGNALKQLSKLLAEYGLSWNDLPDMLAASNIDTNATSRTAPPSRTAAPIFNVLDLTLHLIEQYGTTTKEERLVLGLWVLHTHVYQQFKITPRLALLSPVRGCGKTTLLELIEQLCVEPFRVDNLSAASIYHQLASQAQTTFLIDEGDNLGLRRDGVLRAVFNSGHRRGGATGRVIGGRAQRFPTFAPVAVAAICELPLTLLDRSIVINMQRHARADAQIQQLDESDPAFPVLREEIQKWASNCLLARDPEMPPSLHNRAADNWRVLIAIADDLGFGEDARSAAVKLCADRIDEDPGVVLLTDIRTVFTTLGVDRIPSSVLVEALLGLDDGIWNEWRGENENRVPRKLTQGELARLLRPFGIRPRTVWPALRRPGAKSSRGYYRSDFERSWAAYCPPADTPTQTSKVIRLLRR